ncbi:transporter substrate-binding protein [Rhodovulum sp.]|uniref:transporter substrate-binding protein n=1 Tax=Rhodovulum sp. TaxID=34009 RepID=UPI0017A7FAEC|nr:transporter substrate-binding protein [Rhodovulum sp.]HDR28541.1 hypothetical protein [Rhodovulum sp.]
MKKIKTSLAGAVAFSALSLPAWAQDSIKVGVLHSLSGTMAIPETTLKDTMLMLIDEQNKKGGVLGKQLEAVVVDPASDWPLFAEKARELLTVSDVDVMFGCWTSVSMAVMDTDHHLSKPVLIDEILADGQFDIISQTEEVPGDAWTDFMPESAVLTSDRKDLGCGMYNTETQSCVQIKSNY